MGNNTIKGLELITDQTLFGKLQSRKSIDLLAPPAGPDAPSVSQQNFHHTTTYNLGVLADVREGGLKRDLSTLLERQIDIAENSNDFMLYRFTKNDRDEQVPIQDLSAYYQMYQNDPQWSNGRRSGVNDELQVEAPDYGSPSNKDRYLRDYTSMYRSPVPIKVQFVMGLGATEITATERQIIDNDPKISSPLRPTDIYKMFVGIMPVVTLWNPNNLPLVMGTDAAQILKFSTPPFALRFRKYQANGDTFTSNFLNLNYAIGIESTGDGRARLIDPYVLELRIANSEAVTFQPGESKIFSVPVDNSVRLSEGGGVLVGNAKVLDAENIWDPYGLYVASNSAPPNAPDVVKFKDPASPWVGQRLVFGKGDKIEIGLFTESTSSRSRAVSGIGEIYGAGFNFWMSDPDYVTNPTHHFRNYQLISRFGGSPWKPPIIDDFNAPLMLSGFPQEEEIDFQGIGNAIDAESLYEAVDKGEVRGIAMFSLMAACESLASQNAGAGTGRRITTRPFLHGSTLTGPRIADNSKQALYDYGWEWQIDEITDVEVAIQEDGDARGYYGGGYNSTSGSTHTVQQYLPVLPPISIASLSSTHLGGYSLANNTTLASPDTDVNFTTSNSDTNYALRGAPLRDDFRQTTATGQGGILPHSQQAIGNAYAHPNIAPEQAFTNITELLNTDIADNEQVVTYADHSYLANKALWDEFFFSSITPQREDVPLQEAPTNQSAVEVAESILFEDGLPANRRLTRYTANLTTEKFQEMSANYSGFKNGFADKIASYLMLNGPFNVNSTSVEAWKVFFSSLRDKPVAYLEDGQSQPATATPPSNETTVNPGMLANGEPLESGDLNNDPNDPVDQWSRSRTLSDTEIEELANAMVKQVKLRGPFLSLSDFINRRLINPGSNEDELTMALKGALQAALDDDSVSINEAFRGSSGTPGPREFSAAEQDSMSGAAFPEAATGPIAYGSTPYIDQADILRHCGPMLTPRGDTFLIRAYGDSLDANGKVTARAWCEAVVQRTPEYVDSADESHEMYATLNPTNQNFGRKFQITSYRWLNADEV